MNDVSKFYVGYDTLPDKDRRFLLKAVPVGLLGVAGLGAYTGTRAASNGGGRWETGTPVTLTGRLGFHPYPTLWVDGQGVILAGIGKIGTDFYTRQFEGQVVKVTGVKIVRDNCFLLGVAQNDIRSVNKPAPALPEYSSQGEVSLVGEVLDAQCFMGIMVPGYGRSHRGCATLCVRGGQPVYFSMGIREAAENGGETTCGGTGFLLSDFEGGAANKLFIDKVSVPLTMKAELQKIGNLSRLIPIENTIRRL